MSQALIDTYWARSSALALTSTILMKGENRLEYSAQGSPGCHSPAVGQPLRDVSDAQSWLDVLALSRSIEAPL